MKGYYFYERAIDIGHPSGVEKKVLDQIAAFRQAGMDCQLYVMEDKAVQFPLRRVWQAIRRRLPYGNVDPRWRYDPAFALADFFYLRKPSYLTVHLRRLLKKIKRNNPKAVVLMELPTYPYDKEMQHFGWDWPFWQKEQFNRVRLNGLVDKIVAVADREYKEIFGIPAMRLMNGIQVANISPRQPVFDDVIDICCVAVFAKWHGYERLFDGLKNYYAQGGKRQVLLHMVGEGPELRHYQQLAQDPLLRQHVVFYGHLTGAALDKVYNQADMAATSLGCHRIGIGIGSFLKSREYLAKGLPLITGCPIDVLQSGEFKYYLQFPAEERALEFSKIIAFYDGVCASGTACKEAAKEIRAFAAQTVDTAVTMRPVINYIAGVVSPKFPKNE